jgi:hypothetical protein
METDTLDNNTLDSERVVEIGLAVCETLDAFGGKGVSQEEVALVAIHLLGMAVLYHAPDCREQISEDIMRRVARVLAVASQAVVAQPGGSEHVH